MPAFTAIGTFIATQFVTAGLIAAGGFAFTAIASVAAIGAAYITSRVINGNPNKGSLSAVSQGGRIQVPPATNNKIPVVYGSAFVNGTITDAWLTSSDQKTNDVMYYCMVLSETHNIASAEYYIDDIYWGDQRLVFETSGGNQHKVLKGVKKVDGPGEDFENADFKIDGTNLVEFRVYAGNSTAAQQIFPAQSTGNTANAYTYWPDSQWTSAHQMEGLVFAVIKLKYNAEKGFTNLPNVTFKLRTTVDPADTGMNPALVWRDYMTGQRYGANISSAAIPTGAGTAYETWYNYCDELIRYTDKDAVSTTQKRYEINGVIDTNNSVKANIDSILQNGGAWLSYDVATGQWKPTLKKAISAGDPATSSTHFTASVAGTTLTVTAFPEGRIEAGQALYKTDGTYLGTIVSQTTPLTTGESTGQVGRYTISASHTIASTTFYTKAVGLLQFDDDNILTGISISSTRLDDLYNKYEVEFFDKYNKDQRAYARDEIAAGDRNPTEPDNQLRLGLEFTNNSVQAELLGNIELRQSRDDLVIEFTASHYGIQAQAGDVIEVTNDIYGWAPKLFRVMRVKEIETEEGGLVAEIQALEYNADVYTVEAITEFTTEENIGIAPARSGGTNGNYKTPDDNRVSVVEVNTSAAVPYIAMAVKIPTTGGPYEIIEIWYAENTIGVTPSESAYTRLITHKPPPPDPVFDNGRTITATSITGTNTLNTATAHNLSAGDQVYFTSTTSNGLTQNKAYWVLSAGLTATAFRLSLTENGTALTLTNGTGLTLNFDTCHIIYITQLPANQTGQEYFFRVRVGGSGYFSGFTDPDNAVIATPVTPWTPGGSSAGFNLTGAQEGDTIYYDATSGYWKNNYTLTVSDTTNWVRVERPFVKATEQDRYFRSGLIVEKRITDATANDDNEGGPAVLFTRSFGAHTDITPAGNGRTGFAILSGNYRGTDYDHSVNISIADSTQNFENFTLGIGTVYEAHLNSTSIQSYSSNTNATQPILILTANTSGTPAVGYGGQLVFETESAPNVFDYSTIISSYLTDVTSGSEDSALQIDILDNGALNTVATFYGNGDLILDRYLQLNGNEIKSSTGATAITLNDNDVTVADTLNVNGNVVVNADQTVGNSTITMYDGSSTAVLTWTGEVLTTSQQINLSLNDTTTPKGFQGVVANSDFWFVGGYDTTGGGSNAGAMVIATGNNGNEPIYVRQYTGGDVTQPFPGSNTIARTLTLLDASGNTDIPGSVTIAGDLTVNGTTTTLNTQTLNVEDNIITLNYGQTSPVLNAGIEVARGSGNFVPVLRWNESTDRWQTTVDGTTYINIPNQELDTTSEPTFAGATIGNVTIETGVNGQIISTSTGNLNLYANTSNIVLYNDLYITNNLVINQDQSNNDSIIYAYKNTNLSTLTWNGTKWVFAHGVDVTGDLTVTGTFSAGSIAVDSRVYFDSGTLTTSNTTANQTLDSWNASTYRTVKYVVSMTSGTDYQSVEILVTHNGTTAVQTTYADIKTGTTDLATFDVTISGGNVLLRTTPTNSVTVYNFSKQLIVV